MDNLLNIVANNQVQGNQAVNNNARLPEKLPSVKEAENTSFKQALNNAEDSNKQVASADETAKINEKPLDDKNVIAADNKDVATEDNNAIKPVEIVKGQEVSEVKSGQDSLDPNNSLPTLNNILADLINKQAIETASQILSQNQIADTLNALNLPEQIVQDSPAQIDDVNNLILTSALANQANPAEVTDIANDINPNQDNKQSQDNKVVLNLLSGGFSVPLVNNTENNNLNLNQQDSADETVIQLINSNAAKQNNNNQANALALQSQQIIENEGVISTALINASVKAPTSDKVILPEAENKALGKDSELKINFDVIGKIASVMDKPEQKLGDKKEGLFGDIKIASFSENKNKESAFDFDSIINNFDSNKKLTDISRHTVDSNIKIADAGKFIHANIDEAPYKIIGALKDGHSKINIKLEPLELGKIEVRLDINRADGMAKLIVTADKAESLEILQREAKSLEKALTDVGFKSESTSLNFNLRGNSEQWKNNSSQNFAENNQNKNLESEDVNLTNYINPGLYYSMDKALDIRV